MINTTDAQAHWESVYAERKPTETSWFEAVPETSLRLIESAGLPSEAPLLDVGGGVSRLAPELRAAGYTDVTVADISSDALKQAQLLPGTEGIRYRQADVRKHDFGRVYDLWHDRAVFHFMVGGDDQDAYLATLDQALRPGGHLIIATFGPEAPTKCSGLPVVRYGPEELSARLGDHFSLLSAETHIHVTPSGKKQQFVYAHLKRGE
jgi:2-polyprenyl-3-methyl-5-hydroxy-6-metoxy-1,4-benzoquinol methylase